MARLIKNEFIVRLGYRNNVPWSFLVFGSILAFMVSAVGCGEENTQASPGEAHESSERIVHVTTVHEFDNHVMQADKPVMVDFYATWCPPCKLLAPIIEQLAAEYKGRAEFAKVDGDQLLALLAAHNIEGYPTVLIFKGGKLVKTFVGLYEAGDYRAALDAAIAD